MSGGNGNRFVERVDLELKRAQRYRIFVSLIVLDLTFVEGLNPRDGESFLNEVAERVNQSIRAVDNAAIVGQHKLALLLPETPRQGAGIAAQRLSSLIKQVLAERTEQEVDQVVPLEMASYPDAAGARTIEDFVSEFSMAS